MGSLPEGEYLARSHHVNLLQTLGHNNKMVTKTLIRSYARSFNGFAANLTASEVSKLKSVDEVVSVFKSRKFQIQTTKSWDYLGMTLDVPRYPTIENNIIIGHLDTGVLPESHSFSDQGLSPIPKKWKGACVGGKKFSCNKKLIGARFYDLFDDKAMDIEGHGTHTASIAAGRILENTNFFGLANGTARGGVPSARIATYKVCTALGCYDHDMLAGFDDAISDGVDIITISISYGHALNISENSISIGSFHALEKDILTVNAAGNNGNKGIGATTSIAPWIFSVAASKDRNVFNKLVLGNGHTIASIAVNTFEISNQNTRLVYGRGVSHQCNESLARQCAIGCVDPLLVKGKIILCDLDSTDLDHVFIMAGNAGASGVIVRLNETFKDLAPIVPLPTAIINDHDFHYVESYLKSKTLHSAHIMKTDIVRNHAPIVTAFSSRGPNTILPEIFKPDIAAPGFNILAAFSPYIDDVVPLRNFSSLRSNYSLLSGTSMSCPHVAGVAAYVKSKHFDWSASAIKSSIMTTALNMNGKYNLDGELGHGAGHINPVKANYPGLVYETSIEDYYQMFCSLGSEGDKLRKMFRAKHKCRNGMRTSSKDLNYPAMTASVHKNSSFTVQFLRVVTNVGHANSTYYVEISRDDDTVHVNVEPNVLTFTKLKEKKIIFGDCYREIA
ncbi:subtilisin-like protease SBT4.3 [Impatiens glandulifera]|uniref:subtilisin-like protease SBT4.3 n=1 Tax=Impatiens glandulifera TaxID=253017 RepID=UPI001FB0EFF8|nr:subtilisin-like protease SBT4.3 [Impatiens glandulifera]